MPTPTILQAVAHAVRSVTDSWGNASTNVGIEGKDKSSGFAFYPGVGARLHGRQLTEIYKCDWAIAAIVDAKPDDVFRRGFQIQSDAEADTKTAIDDAIARMEVLSKFCLAQKWERLHGGAAILLGTGESDYSTPLPDNAPLKFLTVYEREELQAVDYYSDPRTPEFGNPKNFTLTPSIATTLGPMRVHASRLIIFPGIETGREERYRNNSWGASIVGRVYDVVRQYGGAIATAAATMSDANQKVYKIKGLVDILTDPNREKLLAARIRVIEKFRSVINAITIDADGEDVTNLATPVTQFAELIEKFETQVSAAAQIPATRLFRQSPDGMNATGASDLTLWNNDVRTEQRDKTGPRLERVIRMLLRSKDGPTDGKEPGDWSIHWPPLDVPTDKEAAEIRKTQSETDKNTHELGVKASTILKARFGGAEYSTELALTAEEIAEIEKLEEIEPPPDDDELDEQSGDGTENQEKPDVANNQSDPK